MNLDTMAKQPSTEDEGNSFSNDGSFMEQFKKMAEHKAKEEQAKREKEAAEKQAKISKPLFSRVTKTKPVVMKLGGFRKKLLPGAKMNKPKVFVDDENAGTASCTVLYCTVLRVGRLCMIK